MSCQEDGGTAILMKLTGPVSSPTFEPLWSQAPHPFALHDAVDGDGDGMPELVVEGGLLAWDAALEAWAWWRPLDFPDEVGDCYCECE